MHEMGSSERQAWLRDRKRSKYLVHLAQVLMLICFFWLWELAARLEWIDAFIVSSPSRICATVKTCMEQENCGRIWEPPVWKL